MKKAMVIGLAVVIGLFLVSAVYAVQGGHGSHGAGTCPNTPSNVDVETLKKFHKETFSLRDEIMTKKIELRGEYSKQTPDTNRIATIQKEIIDLKAKVQEIANKYGIKGHAGHGMMGRGMMGTGHGMMGKMNNMCDQCPMSQQ